MTRPDAPPRPPATGTPDPEADGAGFDGYVRSRQQVLIGTAFLLTGDAEEAEELVVAALARLYRSWDRVGRVEAPDSFARRAIVEGHTTWWRHARHGRRAAARPEPAPDPPSDPRLSPPLRPPPDPTPADEAARASAADIENRDEDVIWGALRGLTPRERAVVVLLHHEDLTELETADVLGRSAANVVAADDRTMFTLRCALGARRVVAAPQVTHSLTRTLRRRAERLAPRPILVGPARVRAGHLRRTRRWTVAAVVLVVGATFAMPASLGGRDRAGEGGSRRTSVSLAAARTRTSNVPPLRALPAGTAPRIGWLDADGYHPTAGVAIVVPSTLTTVVSSRRDLVGVRSGHDGSQLVPLTAGSLAPPERRATTPVVSADGSAIAWYARHGREGTLTVIRGDGSYSVDVRAVAPLGFARADGGPLLLTEPGATSDLSVVRRLLPGTGAIDPRWNRPGIGVAVSPLTGDLVVLRPWSLGSCFVLLGPEGRTRWRACTPAVGARPPPEWVGALGPFSPDGRYLLARGIPREVGNGAFAVIDVRTGRVLHRYDTSAAALRMFGDAVFEDDGHVLVAMYERGSTALVRCDFHGHCESATTPVRTPAQRWTSHPFGRT